MLYFKKSLNYPKVLKVQFKQKVKYITQFILHVETLKMQ